MNSFLYTLVLAFVNNVDNIGVRIAYSLRGIRLSVVKNLWISIVTFVISTVAAQLGRAISGVISVKLCSYLSMFILVVIGLWIILEPVIEKNRRKAKISTNGKNLILDILRRPEAADINDSKDIDFREATYLAVALSLNNIGGCFSGGIMGLNSLLIGFMSALVSFVALWAGNYLTDIMIKCNMGRKVTVVAGIILILMGIRQIF